jgi:hypothetical protein
MLADRHYFRFLPKCLTTGADAPAGQLPSRIAGIQEQNIGSQTQETRVGDRVKRQAMSLSCLAIGSGIGFLAGTAFGFFLSALGHVSRSDS